MILFLQVGLIYRKRQFLTLQNAPDYHLRYQMDWSFTQGLDYNGTEYTAAWDAAKLKTLPSLSAIYAHRNLVFIGPAGTGKTHLAQAFGYECCQRGIKTYFIKMSELRDKFTAARRAGKEASILNGLVRPSCLIIDEVGYCEFDKENTRLFFDLIDWRYNKEGK